jgi:peptidoglycan L-alanyl-D-glutamate endopeptidase CwlK|tara:strand:- start:1153 stop:1545 length:393 start_codon:yes stop_codon:yes gene_type:complete
MPKFGKKSKERLASCEKDLQILFKEVVKHFDCTVTQGHRKVSEQEKLYKEGKTKVKFGKHNYYPSIAVDVTPYPVDYENIDRHYYFGGFVLGIAESMGIDIRWGGDWDSDRETKDQTFNDLVHFELRQKK